MGDLLFTWVNDESTSASWTLSGLILYSGSFLSSYFLPNEAKQPQCAHLRDTEGNFAIGGHSHGCWNPHCSLISLGTWQFKSFSSWSYALISLSSEQNLVTRYFSVGLNFVNLSEQRRIQYFCLHMCLGRKNHHGVMQGSLVSSKGGKNESWKAIGWINYKLLTGI